MKKWTSGSYMHLYALLSYFLTMSYSLIDKLVGIRLHADRHQRNTNDFQTCICVSW